MKIKNITQLEKYALDNFGRRSGKERRVTVISGFFLERRGALDRRVTLTDRRKTLIGRTMDA